MSELPTIFRETAAALAGRLREAAVDHQAFEKPLPVCRLEICRATCCYDGAILSEEEAAILSALDDRDGIVTLPDGRQKTRTVVAERDELAEEFPAHFERTRCVYLDDWHHCHWQSKAAAEAKPAWFYKPISCWMHPVLLTRSDGRPLLTVLSPENDSQKFASETPCGRPTPCASPARVSLARELEMLCEISGRNLSGELNAPALL